MTVAQLAERMRYEVSERTINRILTDYPEFDRNGEAVFDDFSNNPWPKWHLVFDPDPPPPLSALPSIPRTPRTVCNVCVKPVLTDEYGRCPTCQTPLLVWPAPFALEKGPWREELGPLQRWLKTPRKTIPIGSKANHGFVLGMMDEVLNEAYRLYCDEGYGLVRVSEQLWPQTHYKSARSMSRALYTQFCNRGWPVRTRLCGVVTFNYRHGKLRREWEHRDHEFALAQKHARGEMRMVKCKALKKQPPGKGKPCRHYALADSEYCQSHDPRRVAARAEHLTSMRAKLPPRRDLLTDEERRTIHELVVGQGLTRHAVARQIGRPWSTVNRVLRETPD
jgi:hypothetical protein